MPIFLELWQRPEGAADLIHYWSNAYLGGRYDVATEMMNSLRSSVKQVMILKTLKCASFWSRV
jgi:hypothetical protein